MGYERSSLGTRSRAARLPEIFVRRSRLEAILADDVRRPVTLISAPPGSGKTTLVTAAFGSRHDAALITVDWRDNELGQLAGLIADTVVARGGLEAGAVDPGLPATALLDIAFGALELDGTRLILVVDDVHELTSSDALSTLGYLVERAPPTLELVLCSRADPPVRLTRLRLEGRLGEIRSDRLAFDRAEASDLLAAHGVRLTRSQVDALWRRTDGWAAGLRLAACALQTEADPREFVQGAASSESVIVDYLLKELLTRQDESVQQFLLRTSVAERMTAELAEALTDDDRAGEQLRELERNGVFSTEVEDRTWYRYHPLFASLLQARLRLHHRGLAGDLHRRAADWFLTRGLLVEAEAQARAAGDWTNVGLLASRRWLERMLAGVESSDSLLAGIPASAVGATEGLALLAAADACARLDRSAADAYRAAADDLAAGASTGAAGARCGAAQLPEARALLDIVHAGSFGADARARGAVARLRATPAADGGGGLARLAHLRSIGIDLDDGEIERARREAATLARGAESTWIGAEALAMLTLADALEGDVALASRHGEHALSVDAASRGVARHVVRLGLAVCHALRGEPRHALALLNELDLPWPSDRWLRSVDVAVRAALRAPGSTFVGLEADDAAHPLADRALVSLGVLEAVDTSGRVQPIGGPLEEAVLLARQRWRSRDGARVLDVLGDPADPLPAGCHPRTIIERAGLIGLAAAERGADGLAVAALSRALGGIAATGICAPLLALSPELADLLAEHAADLGRHQGLALELIDRARLSPGPAFVEPLTERETAVLRHLPTLMSNHEIADRLHVSVNTVKTHLKSLYRKLGVTSRREAVQRGRVLELL